MFVEGEGTPGAGQRSDRPGEAAQSRAAAVEQIPLERLEHEITQLASHINAGMCRWLQLVAEFDRREGWSSWGCRSCAEWVAWRCALDPRTAREHVRVARRLAQLPGIREAFGRGELSFTKVRALTRVADADSEDELLDLAHFATAAQLERIVRAYRRVSTRDANEVHEDRSLSWFWEPDGSLSVHGRLSPEDGALFLRAVESARDELWKEAQDDRSGPAEPQAAALGSADGSAEPRPEPQQTNADALMRVAEKSLSQGEGTRSAGDRTQVVVHIDAETLAGDEHQRCELDDGVAIAPETARRLGCDSSLVSIVESADGTLSVGRKRGQFLFTRPDARRLEAVPDPPRGDPTWLRCGAPADPGSLMTGTREPMDLGLEVDRMQAIVGAPPGPDPRGR